MGIWLRVFSILSVRSFNILLKSCINCLCFIGLFILFFLHSSSLFHFLKSFIRLKSFNIEYALYSLHNLLSKPLSISSHSSIHPHIYHVLKDQILLPLDLILLKSCKSLLNIQHLHYISYVHSSWLLSYNLLVHLRFLLSFNKSSFRTHKAVWGLVLFSYLSKFLSFLSCEILFYWDKPLTKCISVAFN